MPPTVTLHLLTSLPDAGELPTDRAFARILSRAGVRRGEVNLVLTDAAEIRRLNREFAGKDRATDVLAFEYGQDGSGDGDAARRAAAAPSGQIHGDVADRAGAVPPGQIHGDVADRAGAVPPGQIHGDVANRAGAAPPGQIYGDVFVSADAAREQALERGLSTREELTRLFLHGCLHLLGYRDKTAVERARMEEVQEAMVTELLTGGRR